MKKYLTMMFFLTVMVTASISAKAQEVTITLFSGWNWISYPNPEMQDINTALGDFTPVNGDIIKSQYGSSSYINGYWRGSVTHFMPGWGYKYYSNRIETVSFVFGTPVPQLIVTTTEPSEITMSSAICGGNVISCDGNYVPIIVRGICWSCTPNPTFNDDYIEVENGIGSFTASLTELIPNTTYYVRAFAVTANETFYGEQEVFCTKNGIPTLTTSDVTDITGTTATCGGDITDDGGLNIIARGVCWSMEPNPTIADSHSTDGEGIGNFNSSLSDLSVSTIYYIRSYATTTIGTGYGEEKSFVTRDGIPSLTTADITEITGISATCGGNISDDGGLDIIARGVCWSTSPNPTITNSQTIDGIGLGSFSSSIADLSVSTTYYVRAYATTATSTAYGEQKSFTTQDGIPVLTTMEITNLTGTSAMSGGVITDDCGLSVIARGVCWSSSPNPTIDDNHNFNGTGTGSFISSFYGLTINTTYYIRAYATTEVGIGYGNEVSFTTGDDSGNAPIGAINGLFSVSENHQVYFSQGNLQYQASTSIWRFAENQWDYVGDETQGTVYENNVKCDNSLISSTYDGWIDLFCWGTGNNPLNKPHGYNITFSDWGSNAINNGGNINNTWRTLNGNNEGEWDYVFNIRSTNSNIRFAKAQVNDINGVILLPDDWSSSAYSLNSTNIPYASFSSNIISASQWTILENSGAVFLPAAGYRYGSSVYEVNCGYYWSSTGWYSTFYGYPSYYFLRFSDDINAKDYNGAYFGRSVRLVQDYN